jgi:hypothetical protein
MSNVTFHTSRTAARTVSNSTVGVSFKDFGKDAEKGKRWATISMAATAPTLKDSIKPARRAATTKPRNSGKKPAAVALIVKMMADGASRKEIIAKLVDKVGLTAPGSSTYYANVKNKAPGWTL